jgi:outer membrane lipoprotein-sorting protein
MKRILINAALALTTLSVWGQQQEITQDPQAGAILERITTKVRAMKSIQADFELVIEDRVEKTKNTSSGNLLMRQNMYKITTTGSTIYFNGKTMWTYLPANNEVTITEPGNQADDFMSNPTSIFSLYNRDFKYQYLRETTMNGSQCHQIDLYPKNLNQPYTRIRLYVGVKSELPEIISTMGKDGIDYNIYLKNYKLDLDIPATSFNFDATKFKKVEVVDMRGL